MFAPNGEGVLDSTLYVGSVLQGVDPKGRVVIPADFRDVIEARSGKRTVFFSPHETLPCLQAFDETWVNELDAEIRKQQDAGADAAAVRRQREAIFADAERAAFDPAGRVNIPDFYRNDVKIGSWAVFAGAGPVFNIWAPEVILACDDVSPRTRARVADMIKTKKARA